MKKIVIKLGSQNTINIITLIAGICLLLFPSFFVKTVCYIAGAACICFAIFKFIMLYRTGLLSYTFFLPLITFFFGLMLIYSHNSILSLLPLTVGIYLIAGGINGIIRVKEMRGSFSWTNLKYFIPSAISLIFGLVLLLFPFGSIILVLRVVGAALIYSALQGYITFRFYSKPHNNNGPIEAEFEDKE